MKRVGKVFLISLQVVLIAICLVSGGYLFYHMVYVPQRNRQMVEKLKEEFPEETDLPGETPPKEKNSPAGEEKVLLVDLLALQDRYPDIQGWLTQCCREAKRILNGTCTGIMQGNGMLMGVCSCNGTAMCPGARTWWFMATI